jgi:glycosyltransferase involved in cell wall biosynthesis
VSDILRKSDIFLDLSEYQAFGRTGLEAMACGCVPVLPSIGGVSEYAINNHNSLIVNTKLDDLENIVSVTSELVCDKEMISKMKVAAINTSHEYSIEYAAQSVIDLFATHIKRGFDVVKNV